MGVGKRLWEDERVMGVSDEPISSPYGGCALCRAGRSEAAGGGGGAWASAGDVDGWSGLSPCGRGRRGELVSAFLLSITPSCASWGGGGSREGGALLVRLFAEQKQGEGGIAGLKPLQMCQLFCGLQQCLLTRLHSAQSQPKSELEPCPSVQPSAEKGTG